MLSVFNHTLSDTDAIDIIQLLRSKNIGCINFSKAVKRFGSVKRTLEALHNDPKILGRSVTICQRSIAEKEYENGIQSGGQFIAYNMDLFPPLLSQIYDSPPFFWTKGNIYCLQKPACAIVGARNASVGGRKIAYSLAKNLGLNKFITISGLATGIDTAAHQGSLKTGTIAIMASGINVIYPDENLKLAQDILDQDGLIISEAPPSAPPQAKMFVRRNRIISALSIGTVIVEAAEKSGSLTTAEYAIEQNKEIFAVPGSPLDIRAAGTNRLLRNGAHWAENSDDVISILQNLMQNDMIKSVQEKQQNTTSKQRFLHQDPQSEFAVRPILTPAVAPYKSLPLNNSLSEQILEILSTTPISCDDLIRLLKISSEKILPALSMMELEGDISRQAGNMIVKTIKRAK